MKHNILTVVFMFCIVSCSDKDINYLYQNGNTDNYCVDKDCSRLKGATVFTHVIGEMTFFDDYHLLCPVCTPNDFRKSLKERVGRNHMRKIRAEAGIKSDDSFFMETYKLAKHKELVDNIYIHKILLSNKKYLNSVYEAIKDIAYIWVPLDFDRFERRSKRLAIQDSITLGIVKPNDNIHELYDAVKKEYGIEITEEEYRERLKSLEFAMAQYTMMSSVRYNINGKSYNVPEDRASDFETQFPDATVMYSVGSKTFDISISEKLDFEQEFKDAKYWRDKSMIPFGEKSEFMSRILVCLEDTLSEFDITIRYKMDSNTQRLYNAINGKYDLGGDYETFKDKLKDSGKREALYNQLHKDNYNVGSLSEFNARLGYPD
ncbi:MAG: hypothetical protein LBV74_09005 [Tannerella sp.]|jgi:hypothetical protein|nr:hypothetical protein [Tannerella sp.]